MALRKKIGIANAFEKAVTFDANNNYARISADGASFQFTGQYAMGAWIKTTIAGNSGAVVMANDQVGLEIGSPGDRPSFTYFGHWNDNPPAVELPLKDKKWHFVVVSLNGANDHVYCDGRLLYVGSRADSIGLPTGGTYFTVGSKQDGSAKFGGMIKCAFLCNSGLTAAQVRDLYAVGPISAKMVSLLSGYNLKALWPFNNDYTDASGNGNTLSAVGTPAPTFADVNGSDFNRGVRTVI